MTHTSTTDNPMTLDEYRHHCHIFARKDKKFIFTDQRKPDFRYAALSTLILFAKERLFIFDCGEFENPTFDFKSIHSQLDASAQINKNIRIAILTKQFQNNGLSSGSFLDLKERYPENFSLYSLGNNLTPNISFMIGDNKSLVERREIAEADYILGAGVHTFVDFGDRNRNHNLVVNFELAARKASPLFTN